MINYPTDHPTSAWATHVGQRILVLCARWYAPDVPLPVSVSDMSWLRQRCEDCHWYSGDLYRLAWLAGAVNLEVHRVSGEKDGGE